MIKNYKVYSLEDAAHFRAWAEKVFRYNNKKQIGEPISVPPEFTGVPLNPGSGIIGNIPIHVEAASKCFI